jgi:hypothetical protein
MSGMMLAFAGGSYGAAPVNTVAPVVSGTATVGQTLSTTNGTWTGAPAPTFTYQWQRVTTNISGATSSTYVLVAADVANTIRCVVKATNTIAPAGVTANSNSTASVAASVPGAPTIGTATQTGATTATVAYTAPASNGGATITVYTATSSPGSITGTLSQAGSGTITVSGLSTGVSYTFTVKATNSVGQSAASAASNAVVPTALGYYVSLYGTPNSGGTIAKTTRLDSSGNGYSWIRASYGGSGNSIGIALTSTGSTTFKNEQYLTSGQTPYSYTLDSSNNFYFAGSPGGGGQPIGVTKVNSSGTIQWQKAWTDSTYANFAGHQSSSAPPIVNSSGDIYFSVTANLESCCITYYSAMVMKVDSSGTGQWRKVITSTSSTDVNEVMSLGFDSSSNVYALVKTNSRAQLVKMDSSGTKLASSQFTRVNSSGSVTPTAMVFDTTNSVGYFIAGFSSTNMVFVKFDTSVAFTYAKTLTNVYLSPFSSGAIAVDSSGNVYVAVSKAPSLYYPVIIKYDSSGTIQWQRQLTGASGDSFVYSIAIQSTDFVISGYYTNTDNYAFIFKAPTDGSNTGSFVNNSITWTYAAYTGSTAGTTTPYDNGTTVAFTNVTISATFDPTAVPATATNLTITATAV